MSQKVSEQLIETIGKAGITRIYAVAGDSLNYVNDAVRRQDAVKWIHVRHEETGAFAASAEAQLNGIACCAGSSGPGHVHLINGVYDAQRSGAPVLVIASTCPSTEFGTKYFQETNTITLFDDCSGYNQIATTPEQFPRMLQQALQHSYHKKEVSVIGLPGDLAPKTAVESITATFPLPGKSIVRPPDEELEKLADLIKSSKKITLFCGIGARDAHDEVIELASKIKAPVAYSFKSKMHIQYDNPYEIGLTGLLGTPAAFSAMHEADLLILLGTDFPYVGYMPTQPKIVQIDIKPELIGRRARVSMGLGGDIKYTLDALLPMIEEKSDDTFLKRQLEIYDKVKEHLADKADKNTSADLVSPEYVTAIIDKVASDDAIFTVDTGLCCFWASQYLNATGKRDLLASFNHGTMANAMPMAIGAALARPDQQIVAMCGDGGFSMLLGDLATIVQYQLPIKLFVFDNRALGMVKMEMEVIGLPDSQTDMANPDFAAVAEAMGMKGFSIHDGSKAEEIIKEAFNTEGPVLVNVYTDPNELSMPPKIEFDQMSMFTDAMANMIIEGQGEGVWDSARRDVYLKP